MYRSSWELDVYARHHIAELVGECPPCYPIDRDDDDGPASLVTQLRHRLGIGLIQAGIALAGSDAVRKRGTVLARPAPYGTAR